MPPFDPPPAIGAAAGARVQLNVVNEVTFLSTALWMTASGLGPSIMPLAYAREPVHRELAVKKLTHPMVSRDISVVSKRGRLLSPACEGFLAVLHRVLAAKRS